MTETEQFYFVFSQVAVVIGLLLACISALWVQSSYTEKAISMIRHLQDVLCIGVPPSHSSIIEADTIARSLSYVNPFLLFCCGLRPRFFREVYTFIGPMDWYNHGSRENPKWKFICDTNRMKQLFDISIRESKKLNIDFASEGKADGARTLRWWKYTQEEIDDMAERFPLPH